MVAVVASYIYFLITHKRKVVSFTHNSTPVLVEDKPAGLAITYSGTVFKRPVVNTVLLRAIGNAAIRNDEIESDILSSVRRRRFSDHSTGSKKSPTQLTSKSSRTRPPIQSTLPRRYSTPGMGSMYKSFRMECRIASRLLPAQQQVCRSRRELDCRIQCLCIHRTELTSTSALILPLLLVFMRYLSIASAFSGVNNELYLQIDFGWNRRRLYRHRILPAALQIGIRCQASKDIPL